MLAALLDRYQPEGDAETADVRAVRALTGAAADPYQRDLPLHVTASALIVHPPTARVLLRWLTLRGARDLTSEPNLREAIDRIEPLFSPLDPGSERSALMSRGKVREQCPAAMVSAH